MDPPRYGVRAPAKINLYLRVIGRRPDGFHLLDSLVLPVDLCDELSIQVGASSLPRPEIHVTCDPPTAPDGPANLAFKAAELFLASVARSHRVCIAIRKRIPPGSGLGGGSSDAAAVLVTLNRLLGSALSLAALSTLAIRIGADVPFFVYGRPARVGGIGEVVTPIPAVRPLSLVLCSDGHGVSTAAVYARVDLALTSGRPASNIADFVGDQTLLPELLVNDLEAAAAQIHPGVLSLRTELMECGAQGALMTGSGSAVFGVWPDPESAKNAAMTLRERGLWAEAVQTLIVSPTVAS
jgi:4-diphosphocytidyl-2-C-methyl-D-erythritol kinase